MMRFSPSSLVLVAFVVLLINSLLGCQSLDWSVLSARVDHHRQALREEALKVASHHEALRGQGSSGCKINQALIAQEPIEVCIPGGLVPREQHRVYGERLRQALKLPLGSVVSLRLAHAAQLSGMGLSWYQGVALETELRSSPEDRAALSDASLAGPLPAIIVHISQWETGIAALESRSVTLAKEWLRRDQWLQTNRPWTAKSLKSMPRNEEGELSRLSMDLPSLFAKAEALERLRYTPALK